MLSICLSVKLCSLSIICLSFLVCFRSQLPILPRIQILKSPTVSKWLSKWFTDLLFWYFPVPVSSPCISFYSLYFGGSVTTMTMAEMGRDNVYTMYTMDYTSPPPPHLTWRATMRCTHSIILLLVCTVFWSSSLFISDSIFWYVIWLLVLWII